MIEIRNVSHRINGTPILHDVTCDIPRSGITALIGPNGAGKSTLLNLVARLLPLEQGAIVVDGEDVSRTPSRDLALRLAIVAQQVGIASRLRVQDLVGFGRWPHHRGRPGPQDAAAVAEAISDFGLEDLRHRFLDELSGGQQQRAFVAMGFAQGTDWLLLDEPLNNLDMFHARALMARVHAQTRPSLDRPRSVVMVVHEINYAAGWADHIVALKDGQVSASGSPKDILTPATLSALFGMEIRVEQVEGRPLIMHHL
ncbi:iron ABC transporter ATP-binding protein [Tropicimonas marinistellae]|uniref:iron ABC transporter ATP-binding protein n=1 Tax=Tropicimonas marinistellae TaxID=1739787 RepID=UPI00083600E0|nr:ATP-binding cassette domain-containing protein [Tropicimonas marinistellae]